MSVETQVSELVSDVMQCPQCMDTALEAVQSLRDYFSSPTSGDYVRAAIDARACQALLEVLRYNPESVETLLLVCGCLTKLSTERDGRDILIQQGGLTLICGAAQFFIASPATKKEDVDEIVRIGKRCGVCSQHNVSIEPNLLYEIIVNAFKKCGLNVSNVELNTYLSSDAPRNGVDAMLAVLAHIKLCKGDLHLKIMAL
jgi:bacterioferritin-associated ferredoxin